MNTPLAVGKMSKIQHFWLTERLIVKDKKPIGAKLLLCSCVEVLYHASYYCQWNGLQTGGVSLSLTVSERQMQREKQAECITSLKCYSSVSGGKDRWLRPIAGDEKQACVCGFPHALSSACVLVCGSYRTLQGWAFGACWDLQSEVPLLQAIKQVFMLLLSLEKTSCCKYDVVVFLTWIENVHLYFPPPL